MQTCWMSREENCNVWEMKKYLCYHGSLMKEDKNVTDCVGLHSWLHSQDTMGWQFLCTPLVKGSGSQTKGYNLWL